MATLAKGKMQMNSEPETEKFDPENSSHWWKIVDASDQRPKEICAKYGFKTGTFRSWINGRSNPSEENRNTVVKCMRWLLKRPRIPFSRSWGYVLPEQIEALKTCGAGEHDKIVAQIRRQNALKGKVIL